MDLRNEVDLIEQLDLFPVVIVPEMAHVSEACKSALVAYVEAGGRLLLSGVHVAEQYGKLAGVAVGEGEPEGGWLPVGNEAVTVAGEYQPTTLDGAEVLANVLHQQDPVKNQRDLAADTPPAMKLGKALWSPFMVLFSAAITDPTIPACGALSEI